MTLSSVYSILCIIHGNLSISRPLITTAKSLLIHKVTYSQGLGIRCGSLWCTVILPTMGVMVAKMSIVSPGYQPLF